MYFNQVSGTTVHAAEAPWTGTVQLFSGRIEDPFGSLNRAFPPSGVPISGEFGCVKINQYPGLQCPLYPLPLNFVYNDLEMSTPTVHHVSNYRLATLDSEHQRARPVRTRNHRSDVPRAGQQLSELVSRFGDEGEQTLQSWFHVLRVLHPIQSDRYASRLGRWAHRRSRQSIRPQCDEGESSVRSSTRDRILLDVGAGAEI